MERSLAVLVVLLIACQSSPPRAAPEPLAASPAPIPTPEVEAPARADPGPESMSEAERLLAEQVIRSRIEAEKRDAVARHFLEQGREAYRRTRYEEARAHLRHAIELEPSPPIRDEAGELLRRVEGVGMDTDAVFEQVVARANVQVQQAVAEIRVLMQEGQERLSRGDFDAAFDRFGKAEEILRWMPYEAPREILVRRNTALRDAGARDQAESEATDARRLREEARRMSEEE
mgnify:CR=1 FL=1